LTHLQCSVHFLGEGTRKGCALYIPSSLVLTCLAFVVEGSCSRPILSIVVHRLAPTARVVHTGVASRLFVAGLILHRASTCLNLYILVQTCSNLLQMSWKCSRLIQILREHRTD